MIPAGAFLGDGWDGGGVGDCVGGCNNCCTDNGNHFIKSFIDTPGTMHHFFKSPSNLAPLAFTSSLSAKEQFNNILHLEQMILMLAKVIAVSGQYL